VYVCSSPLKAFVHFVDLPPHTLNLIFRLLPQSTAIIATRRSLFSLVLDLRSIHRRCSEIQNEMSSMSCASHRINCHLTPLGSVSESSSRPVDFDQRIGLPRSRNKPNQTKLPLNVISHVSPEHVLFCFFCFCCCCT
jgi:hypothetical protein